MDRLFPIECECDHCSYENKLTDVYDLMSADIVCARCHKMTPIPLFMVLAKMARIVEALQDG